MLYCMLHSLYHYNVTVIYLCLLGSHKNNTLHQCTKGRDHKTFVGLSHIAGTKNSIVKIYIDSSSSLLPTSISNTLTQQELIYTVSPKVGGLEEKARSPEVSRSYGRSDD